MVRFSGSRGNAGRDAEQRSSRAYGHQPGILRDVHAGRTYLSRTDTPIDRSRNAHLQVLMQLQQRNDEIGQVLALLHSWRKQADYENPTIPDARELARSAVAFARDTIAAIEALP